MSNNPDWTARPGENQSQSTRVEDNASLLAVGIEVGVEGTFAELITRDENGNKVHTFFCLESKQTCYYIEITDIPGGGGIAVTGFSGDGTQRFSNTGTAYTHEMSAQQGIVTVYQ